ncbi:MAG: hypothetical protein ACRDOO_21930 [Actinomadura sp.]
MSRDDDAAALAGLKADWPGWEIFRSRGDDGEPAAWYAARWRILTEEEMTAGLAHTLDADNADELREALVEQARIEAGRSESSA